MPMHEDAPVLVVLIFLELVEPHLFVEPTERAPAFPWFLATTRTPSRPPRTRSRRR